MRDQPRTTTEKLFDVAIAIKGIDGGVQILGAVVLAVIPPSVITGLAKPSTSGMLAHTVGRFEWWVTTPLLGQTSFLGLPSSRSANSLARHSASFMPLRSSPATSSATTRAPSPATSPSPQPISPPATPARSP